MQIAKDSMLIWWPKIKDLDIPVPKTEILLLNQEELSDLHNEEISGSLVIKVKKIIDEKFKLPVFIRTDLASGKFHWNESCFYNGQNEKLIYDDLGKHIFEIIEFNLTADIMGLPFKALIIREFIPMDTKFVAFQGDMPVNPERRYFIENGKVLCHHPYWIEEAVEKGTIGYPWNKLPKNWKEIAKEINFESEEEIKLLTKYAEKISKVIDGFWSVDFCKAKNGEWILIDMATGELSWHPKECPFNRTKEIDLFKDSKPLTDKDFIVGDE